MKRWLIAVPLALLMAFALFSLMAWMVENSAKQTRAEQPTLSFSILMTDKEQEVQRRERALPKPPETPQDLLPPPLSQASASALTSPIADADLSLSMDLGVSGLAINAPTLGKFSQGTGQMDQQALPLFRTEPIYPSRALKRKLEGYVVLSFNINAAGKPTEIKIIESQPKRVFDRESIRALKRWNYQPKVIDGKAVEQTGQTVKLEFRLAQ